MTIYATFLLFFFFLSVFVMAHRTSLGMGYRHSEMNRSLQSASASNIVTRLASRAITGHTLPIQVHRHYGTEFYMVLTDDSACIRRCCSTARTALLICTQLERKLEGLCSCMFDPDLCSPWQTRLNNVLWHAQYPFCLRYPVQMRSVTFVRHGNLRNDGYPSLARLHDTINVTSAVVDVVITK